MLRELAWFMSTPNRKVEYARVKCGQFSAYEHQISRQGSLPDFLRHSMMQPSTDHASLQAV